MIYLDKMKSSIILLGIFSGYFFPKDTYSLELFLIAIVLSFFVGFVFPDLMNANSLVTKADKDKVNFKSKISIRKMNTISFWIGVFIFCAAISSLIKYIILNSEVNQLGIIILFFGLGIFIRLLNINWLSRKLLK